MNASNSIMLQRAPAHALSMSDPIAASVLGAHQAAMTISAIFRSRGAVEISCHILITYFGRNPRALVYIRIHNRRKATTISPRMVAGFLLLALRKVIERLGNFRLWIADITEPPDVAWRLLIMTTVDLG